MSDWPTISLHLPCDTVDALRRNAAARGVPLWREMHDALVARYAGAA